MRTTRHLRIRRALAAAVTGPVMASVALTGCGTDEAPESQELSDVEHNDADVAFATDMIPHHAQALALVDLTVGRDLDDGLIDLAETIRAEQAPEIEAMSEWLVDWDEEIPETVRDHSNAGHGSDRSVADAQREMEDGHAHDMAGMLGADDLAALEDASDAEFAALWIDAMIAHHEGAIEMARAQQDDGRYRPAVELAAAVEEAQAAEIDQLDDLRRPSP